MEFLHTCATLSTGPMSILFFFGGAWHDSLRVV